VSAGALFDLHVAVDWSAASVPRRGADSIWCATHTAAGTGDPVNVPTRRAAAGLLTQLIDSHPAERILIGLDFPFGFPAGTAAALALDGAPWRATWQLLAALLTDSDRNSNNRFEVAAVLNARIGSAHGPFWGCPRGVADGRLAPTKPVACAPLPELRLCEDWLRRAGHRPFSVWQLAGAGSVGSQALTGIPVLAALAAARPQRVAVWPFTTGLGRDPVAARHDRVVLAEVWPSWLAGRCPPALVKDAWQVAETARVLAAADQRGELAAWFDPPLPEPWRAAVVGEEGWILGPAQRPPAVS
jgi:precorrin-8X/cobalt-precorrin-8 methylmutase